MENYKSFTSTLEAFFQDYLIKERGLSGQTTRAYAAAFKSYLEYNKTLGIKPQGVSLKDFERSRIVSFLNWTEDVKKITASSRNQRLAAMRSFANFLMMYDPSHINQWESIRSIHVKKTETGVVNHITVEGIAVILQQADTSTPTGRRNLTLMSLLYNAGIRVQELIDLTPVCIRLDKPYSITVKGKGNKKRIVPLDEPIATIVKNYLEETGMNRPGMESHPLFFNAHGGKLTTPGVTYIIKKYANMARVDSPELIPRKISPHVFRHSRAMHLLQGGVQLIYIRDFLGHVSVQTTEVYARADMKRRNDAIANAYKNLGLKDTSPKSWERNPEIMEFLNGFTSRKG